MRVVRAARGWWGAGGRPLQPPGGEDLEMCLLRRQGREDGCKAERGGVCGSLSTC